jgi:hypothetical protein
MFVTVVAVVSRVFLALKLWVSFTGDDARAPLRIIAMSWPMI